MEPIIEILLLSIVAGFMGTVIMTASQEIELRLINKRPISFSPALAFFKIFRLNFDTLSYKSKIVATYIIHFGYGTVWGFPLALFYFFGYTNLIFILALYYIIVLFQGWITLWALGIAPPPWSWDVRSLVTELVHKAIYVIVVQFSFTLLIF